MEHICVIHQEQTKANIKSHFEKQKGIEVGKKVWFHSLPCFCVHFKFLLVSRIIRQTRHVLNSVYVFKSSGCHIVCGCESGWVAVWWLWRLWFFDICSCLLNSFLACVATHWLINVSTTFFILKLYSEINILSEIIELSPTFLCMISVYYPSYHLLTSCLLSDHQGCQFSPSSLMLCFCFTFCGELIVTS